MKSSATHLIIALIACGGALSLYWWGYSIIEAKSSEVSTLQQQIDTETETAARTEAAHAAMTEIAGDESSVQNYFVPETGVVSFINTLEQQGKSQGSTVNVLSVSPGNGALPTMLFSLTIEGTFDKVMRTVGVIEYSPYDLYVSQFSITQEGKDSWTANLGLVVGSVVSPKTATSTPQ